MNKERFTDAMSELGERYIMEAAAYKAKAKGNPQHNRHFPIALVAAILALLLVGCTAVAVFFGGSIQSWFRYDWENVTGKPMGEGHLAVIDHLSQQINLSQTCDEVTVTVDSATVGDDIFYVLLRVTGVKLSDKYDYGFDEIDLTLKPDPLNGGGLGGYGIEYLGSDGDGSALFLIDHEYANAHGYGQDTSPLQVELRLVDFGRDLHSQKKKIINEGEWNFSFMIDRSHAVPTVMLSDTEVSVWDHHFEAAGSVLLTDIALTSTGIRFHYQQARHDVPFSVQLELLLKNGVVIDNGGGIATVMEGTELLAASYQWRIPVDLSEVEAVKIGETIIPLSGITKES